MKISRVVLFKMSLKCFSKHVRSFIDSNMLCVENILNNNNPGSITRILCGIRFMISATELYPLLPPIISCINSYDVPVRINIATENSEFIT